MLRQKQFTQKGGFFFTCFPDDLGNILYLARFKKPRARCLNNFKSLESLKSFKAFNLEKVKTISQPC